MVQALAQELISLAKKSGAQDIYLFLRIRFMSYICELEMKDV